MSTPEIAIDTPAPPRHEAAALPVAVSDTRAPGWWGMALFVLSDGLIFAALLAAYYYLAASVPRWPPTGTMAPDLLRPSIMTVILLASSIPMVWADRSIRQGHQGRLKLALALAFVLFAIFLGLQVAEFRSKPFGLTTNLYASSFFVITGLHGLHVLTGLVMSLYLQARAWLGHFNRRRRLAVKNVALYWHFVDGIWVVIFFSLYLWPHWS